MAKAKASVATKSKTKGPKPVLPPAPVVGPAANAPATPADFQPLTEPQIRALKHPTAAQIPQASAVAAELLGSKTYAVDFGPKAVAQAVFAAQLNEAAVWQAEADLSKRWALYAHSRAQLAWDVTLGSADSLNVDAKAATKHDASIPGRYPATTSFMDARSAAAVRAAVTKKAKKKAAAAPVAAAPAAPAPAAKPGS